MGRDQAKLLGWIRKQTEGIDFDYARHPEFVAQIGPALSEIAKREKALHGAAMEAIKRGYKPGPKKPE